MQQTKTAEEATMFDPMQCAENMMRAVQEWADVMQLVTQHQADEGEAVPHEQGYAHLMQVIGDAALQMSTKPDVLMENAIEAYHDYTQLWQQSMQRFLSQEPMASPTAQKDRRFKDDTWQENVWFDFMRQSYQRSTKWMEKLIDGAEISGHEAHKLRFYLRQMTDALSPTNFAMTNPEVLRETVATNGMNILVGLQNMKRDIERGHGTLRISMTDEHAFTFGENIASTPGEVVFQNDMLQLIQYHPTTDEVFDVPLLVVPAWINKYYVLDLRPDNSYVKWLTDQGHTVFIISWVNPDGAMRHIDFEDYMTSGVIASLDAMRDITGVEQASAVGYCLGGTLLASTLAWLADNGQAERVASATYLTTMIDFSEPGELGVFVDEEQISAVEEKMALRGYLDGAEMAMTFNMLRANDLIWSFFVNNYLLGKTPFPFDLLYWNTDSTRLPEAMHSFYLRNMYLDNKLVEAGGITLEDTPIDLSHIQTPSYVLSCKEDHIAPWQSTYAATKCYGGEVEFVLSASGHIAGVVNPPAKGKYGHWTSKDVSQGPEAWFEQAEQQEGSWWVHWQRWQEKKAGKRVPARHIKESIEPAPGSYVKVR